MSDLNPERLHKEWFGGYGVGLGCSTDSRLLPVISRWSVSHHTAAGHTSHRRLYRFLIFAPLLTLKILFGINKGLYYASRGWGSGMI